MDRMEKLALKRLGWSVAGLGMFGVARVVRRRYGVHTVGRVPFPVALGVAGVSALVRHQVEAADRAYQYEKGRADEAAEYAADNEALRKAMAEDDGTRVPLDADLMVRLANTGTPMGEVDRYFRDAAAKMTFKRGGVTASSEYIADQAEVAMNRTLRRQESKGQHPSDGVA